MLQLRPANDDDYDAIAAVLLAADPEYAETAEALRDHDLRHQPAWVQYQRKLHFAEPGADAQTNSQRDIT